MSKKAKKSIEEKLPDRYPRSEEILIFGDMSELDYVFGFLDELKENFYLIESNASDDEQRELINHSGVYTLISVLRKACFEFERFWIDEGNWKPEDDKEFMRCMNDPDELQWLVNELDSGRVKPVEKMKMRVYQNLTKKQREKINVKPGDKENTRFYQPAYYAAARSLQMSMYAYKYPGDKDWTEYCVNQLKQTLTYYHAASLEIAMHRDNVYLNTEVMPNAEVGRKRREQYIEWSALGRRQRGSNADKYTEEDEKKWIESATNLKSKNSALKSARQLALQVISELKLPKSAFESVRKCLAKNGFKLNG